MNEFGNTVLLVKEVAAILRVPVARAYALVRTGRIPSLPLGERQVRIPRHQFFEWLESGGAKTSHKAAPNTTNPLGGTLLK
jgi:excisionase family DNA binding protein